MTAFLSPVGGAGAQFFDNQGVVLAGGKLNTYVAGTTTPTPTWTDYQQMVLNANPIILNSAGRPPNEIWLADGARYKFVLTDANDNILGTWDNITGIGASATLAESEWVTSGLAVTYVGPSQFSVGGDQTSIFQINRRVQYVNSTGTYYGYISNSEYDGFTTTLVTIVPDSTSLDSGLSAVNYSVLNSVNVSVPQQYVKQGDTFTTPLLNATTANITNMNSSNVAITGGTISGIAGFSTPDFLIQAQGVI